MWTKAFILKALEASLAAGFSAFAASNVFTTTPTWKGVVAAAVTAGGVALYQFIKQLGGVQTLKEAAAKAV